MKFAKIAFIIFAALLIHTSCDKDDPGTDNLPSTWEHTFSEFTQNVTFPRLVQTSDEGFIISSDNNVFKLNKGGVLEWHTGLSGSVTSLIPMDNDLYMLVGDSYDMVDEVVWLWCSLIDESGNIQWEKVFKTNQGSYGHGYTAIQNGIDGFTVAGLTNFDFDKQIPDQDQPKLWILNVSNNGSVVSEDYLVTDELPKYYFDNVLIPRDRSGYILSAEVVSDFGYLTFFKMGNDGTLIWDYQFEPTFRSAKSIKESGNGDYIFVGSTQIQAWAIRFTPNGNLIWEKYYGEGERKHWAHSVAEDENGFILTGFTNSKGAGLDDIWVYKIDDKGDMMWDQTYGDTGYDSGSSIIQTFDGGYAATGYIQVGEPSDFNIWVSKMNSKGQIE